YSEFAAHDLCLRPRRCVAAIFRACAPALSVTGCRDHYVRSARVRAFNQRHIRATGGPFECRGFVDVSAVLRCLLGFGATGCALGWQAVQFSWNENCACPGDPCHRLDPRSRHGSRIPRDWNRAGAVVSFLFCAYGVSPEGVGKRQKPISFPPCAIIISKSIIRSCGFPASRLMTSTRTSWSSVQTG